MLLTESSVEARRPQSSMDAHTIRPESHHSSPNTSKRRARNAFTLEAIACRAIRTGRRRRDSIGSRGEVTEHLVTSFCGRRCQIPLTIPVQHLSRGTRGRKLQLRLRSGPWSSRMSPPRATARARRIGALQWASRLITARKVYITTDHRTPLSY